MKTYTARRLLLGAGLPLLLAASGCEDLTKTAQPLGTLDQQTLATLAGVEGSLIGTYRNLDWNGAVGGDFGHTASNWVWGSVASDDAYKGSEATDQPSIDDIQLYQWATANSDGYLNQKWRGVYEGVVRANSTLRLLDQVIAANPAAVPAADANAIRGEAIFLRAHYHFEGWRMWGSIPYYRVGDEDYRKANVPSAEVAQNILVDLDSAIALLPTASRNGQAGRVNRWTATAYKGRVQAYSAAWPAALATLRQVRQSGPYQLETSFDRVWTGYADAANGRETIFAYQASANDGEPNGNNSNYGERLNFPHSGSPFQCCGFHQPSQNLVNYYRVDANGLPLALSSPGTWNASSDNFTGTSGRSVPVDPRLDWTVGRDGVPYKDWGPHTAAWIRAPAYGGTYSPKKNVHEKGSNSQSNVGWQPAQLNSVNIHIFRYADMLLLLAEAEVEAGSIENARTIVNEIRARASQRVQGPGTDRATSAVAINDPGITYATYRIGQYSAAQFGGQAAAREAVRAERRLELAMEGQRFFDLRRWGTAPAVLNAYLAVERTRRQQLTGAAVFADRHRYYPIPNVQIQLSRGTDGTSTLTQNPGW